jgi:hypothetical protein
MFMVSSFLRFTAASLDFLAEARFGQLDYETNLAPVTDDPR